MLTIKELLLGLFIIGLGLSINSHLTVFIIVIAALLKTFYFCIQFSGYKKFIAFTVAIVSTFVILFAGTIYYTKKNTDYYGSSTKKPHINRQLGATADMVFNGDSKALKATKIIATLDDPMPKGVNVIWSASFLSAWKSLQNDFLKQPIALKQNPGMVNFLNNADDLRSSIPTESLYAITGMVQDNIIPRIENELQQKFPGKASPSFILEKQAKAIISYAYLQASINFNAPYLQNDKPLEFTDSHGNKTLLTSFGIREQDNQAYQDLRQQLQLLFYLNGYALDLDRYSEPNQIIIASVEPQQTLEKTINFVEGEIARSKNQKFPPIYISQLVMLVPDIVFNISHHFTELEKHDYLNPTLIDYELAIAQQDISFRLDRNGAELEAKAKIENRYKAHPPIFIFDKPFLVYMKKRGTNTPYFAMWVDNAELLGKWK